MNKRIFELAEQAEIWARQFEVHWGDGPDTNELFKEKFAQLIIQECIAQIETYRIPVGNSAAGEMACELTHAALKEIRADIKQHFEIGDEK
jgi:hypothetical protein